MSENGIVLAVIIASVFAGTFVVSENKIPNETDKALHTIPNGQISEFTDQSVSPDAGEQSGAMSHSQATGVDGLQLFSDNKIPNETDKALHHSPNKQNELLELDGQSVSPDAGELSRTKSHSQSTGIDELQLFSDKE
jgi:hypothetical protein